MRTGVSYMGHYNPRYIETDLREIKDTGCDDVLLAGQENDFKTFTGKIEFTPKIAKDLGLRPIAIFWGVLNAFGGGRDSYFLIEHPEAHQIRKDGSVRKWACYVNPLCPGKIREMIDRIAELGYEGYFIDEPMRQDCFCQSCRALFSEWSGGGELHETDEETNPAFRRYCVLRYVREITKYVKDNYPHMETQCCIMPKDRDLWSDAAAMSTLDNLGTDYYWINDDSKDPEMLVPRIRKLAEICKAHGKKHHQWLQCWKIEAGKEQRVVEHGKVFIAQRPDCVYVWAFRGQLGTCESCENPQLAWSRAQEVLHMAGD